MHTHTQPGVPYRIASLVAPHGSENATSSGGDPDASSYDGHGGGGMPDEDWYQFSFVEGW